MSTRFTLPAAWLGAMKFGARIVAPAAAATAVMKSRRERVPKANGSVMQSSPKTRRGRGALNGWHAVQLALQHPPDIVAVLDEFGAGLDRLVVGPARPRQVDGKIGDDPARRRAEHDHPIRQEHGFV